MKRKDFILAVLVVIVWGANFTVIRLGLGGVPLGLLVIGVASSTNGITSIPIAAILLTIGAPIFWSISNIVAKTASKKSMEKGEHLDMLSLVVWGSLVPPIPTLILALL